VLWGRDEFVLKSAKPNPKVFAETETALIEIEALGLRYANSIL